VQCRRGPSSDPQSNIDLEQMRKEVNSELALGDRPQRDAATKA